MKFSVSLMSLALVAALVGCSSSGDPREGTKNPAQNGKPGSNTQPGDIGGPVAGGSTQPNTAINMLSCMAGTHGTCLEVDPERRDRLETLCQQGASQVVQGGCPQANHVGTCWAHFGDGASILFRYYQPATSTQAESNCRENGGDFTTNY